MPRVESNERARFYFALPRLLMKLTGGSSGRSEQNWVETNVVGAAVHLVMYFFVARLLLGALSVWGQLLLALPLAVIVWLLWPIVFCANAQIIHALRHAGLLCGWPDDRAQGLLIGTWITLLACDFVRTGTWLSALGFLWLAGVALNTAAAAILALTDR